MTQPLNHRHHLRSLDGIRGFAILLVFFFHYYPRKQPHDPLGLLAGIGWSGVDLFFTLSGFLITGILYDTLGESNFFKNFYMRRALRLFPVYILLVAIVLVVAEAAHNHPTIWALPYFVYGSNIIGNLRLPIGVGGPLELGHLWSLALEEQFYLIWPPVLFLLATRKRILRGCIVGAGIAILLRLWLGVHPSSWFIPYNELPTRLDSLLCGGLLAMMLRDPVAIRKLTPGRLRTGLAAGLLALAACVALDHTSYWTGKMMIMYGYAACDVAFFCLIALAIRPDTWIHRLGNWAPLRTLGRYSYGIYLWHSLPKPWFDRFIAWTDVRIHVPILGSLLGFSAVFLVCLGIAYVSYHAIELPFLKLKRYFAYTDERARGSLHADAVSSVRPEAAT
jgi:peptidoglycan/LPS O-acetylase OafA/YrhL